jgi:hypothetical protein
VREQKLVAGENCDRGNLSLTPVACGVKTTEVSTLTGAKQHLEVAEVKVSPKV